VKPECWNSIIAACLEKDPGERLQSARDLKRMIEWTAAREPVVPSASKFRRLMPWAAAAVCTVTAVLVGLHYGRDGASPMRLALTIIPPSGDSLPPVGGLLQVPEISPDGSSVLYCPCGGLWIRRFDSLQPQLIP